MKVFKNNLVKRIEKFNSHIKYETEKKYTENNTEPVTKIVVKKKNTKPDTKLDTKPDNDLVTNDEIKTYIIDKKKLIKSRYKSLLETKKTIRNNIDSIYNALKKLPKESQPKLIELVRLDTILNDSINVVWREIYERDKK